MRRSGKTKWRAARDDKTSWNTPLVVEHKGQTQVIVNGTKRIRSYDLATGAEIWQCAGMTVNAIPSPVAAGGMAYVMSGYNGASAVAVPLDSKGDLGTDGKVDLAGQQGHAVRSLTAPGRRSTLFHAGQHAPLHRARHQDWPGRARP